MFKPFFNDLEPPYRKPTPQQVLNNFFDLKTKFPNNVNTWNSSNSKTRPIFQTTANRFLTNTPPNFSNNDNSILEKVLRITSDSREDFRKSLSLKTKKNVNLWQILLSSFDKYSRVIREHLSQCINQKVETFPNNELIGMLRVVWCKGGSRYVEGYGDSLSFRVFWFLGL